jgi:hypothetical protein
LFCLLDFEKKVFGGVNFAEQMIGLGVYNVLLYCI